MAEASGMSEACKRSESCSQDTEGSETSEDNCNGESKIKFEVTCEEPNHSENTPCTDKSAGIKTTPSFSLRTSKLNPFSSGSLPSTPNSKPFVLNPPKLSNPFLKSDKETESNSSDSVCPTPKTPAKEETGSSLLNLSKSGVSFLPLGGEASTPSQPSSFTAASTPSLGFVFGQNIHEKVEAATPAESSSVAAAEPSPSKEGQEITTNGTSSEVLFQVPKENTEKTSDASKSLSEAAREYEEARAVKRKYDEVPVLTGEEEEANVLQGFATPIRLGEAGSTWREPSRRSHPPPTKKKFGPRLVGKISCRISPMNRQNDNPPQLPPTRTREEIRLMNRRPAYVRVPPPPARAPPPPLENITHTYNRAPPPPLENITHSYNRAPPLLDGLTHSYNRAPPIQERLPFMPARQANSIGIFMPPYTFGGAPQLRNTTDDVYNIYGQLIALRLRGLEQQQRIFAEKLITQILGEAELGHLEEESRIIVKKRRMEPPLVTASNINPPSYTAQNSQPGPANLQI